MGIVKQEELNKHMSSPEWSPEQVQAAARTLTGLESQLEGALFNAPITPRDAVTETAGVTPRGIVMTEYPVFSVSLIADIVVDDAHPLTAPYRLRDGYVRVDQNISGVPDYPSWPPARPLAAVTLTYRPGWGPVEALRQAILEKAAVIMEYFHDDTMIARGTDGQRLPRRLQESRTWTADELKPLGMYRNLSLVM